MKNESGFDLEKYLNDGVELIVKDAIKATIKYPKESLFLAKFALSAKQAEVRRMEYAKNGEHIPAFLIASITKECNLNCEGCYAHYNQNLKEGTHQDFSQAKNEGTDQNFSQANNGGTHQNFSQANNEGTDQDFSQAENEGTHQDFSQNFDSEQMTAEEWDKIFSEAVDLGVSIIMLAGGEPLIRKDVIEKAAKHHEILFPVFSNATMLDEGYQKLFDAHRNLIPIISVEGDESCTDARRGAGVFAITEDAMRQMKKRGLLFGASITVTSNNLDEVTRESFLVDMRAKGCRVVFFIEYVPVDGRDISLSDEQIKILEDRINSIRQSYNDMIVISFPGDEKEIGGCLAAGRGFIHINATGSAEPCPFSPFSDTNVRDVGLRKALKSNLFKGLIKSGLLEEEHTGGCVLFQKEAEVQKLINPDK